VNDEKCTAPKQGCTTTNEEVALKKIIMKIQGQWTGVITYGKEYVMHKNKELYFDLEIIQTLDNISGTSIDIGGVGMSPDPAKITGTFKNKKINFVKQYSSFHYFEKGVSKIDKSRLGSLINYFGEFDELEQKFKGNWIINGKVKLWGIIPIKYINTGTWIMQRK
jgi:hypothetical protein